MLCGDKKKGTTIDCIVEAIYSSLIDNKKVQSMLKRPDKQIQVNVTGPFTVPFFLFRQAALVKSWNRKEKKLNIQSQILGYSSMEVSSLHKFSTYSLMHASTHHPVSDNTNSSMFVLQFADSETTRTIVPSVVSSG